MAYSAPHSLIPAAGFLSPALSQRAVVFASIVALHIVLVYCLATGLARTTVERVFGSTEVSFFNDPPPTVETPPPSQPTFSNPTVDPGPLPEPTPGADPEPRGITTMISPEPVPVAPAGPARIEPIHLVGRHQLPNSEDFYPPSLRRLGVEGATNVRVCVDENGKRQGEPTVTQSSGNARLDEGALAVARAGRFARSARGETFVPNCYGFRIVFKMKPE